jgi:hypothetical protein
MTEKLTSVGYAALVKGEVSGRASFMLGLSTEDECRTALRKPYSSEKIRIQLHPLPQAAIQISTLKDGEVTPFGGSKSP